MLMLMLGATHRCTSSWFNTDTPNCDVYTNQQAGRHYKRCSYVRLHKIVLLLAGGVLQGCSSAATVAIMRPLTSLMSLS